MEINNFKQFINESNKKNTFSEIDGDEVKVYEKELRNLFSFVGDGIFDVAYDLKNNHVWIEFYPDVSGHIELADWNQADKFLKKYINNKKNGLDNYKISFRLDLYFDDDYELGIY